MIEFKELKNLPNDQLHDLFLSVGWSKGDETKFMLDNFNKPFLNATFVLSAWDNDKLVGCVRVISDLVVRSIIQDLVVDEKYRNQGIGTKLVNMCMEKVPKSEWLIPTIPERISFYNRFGFEKSDGIYLTVPSKWF